LEAQRHRFNLRIVHVGRIAAGVARLQGSEEIHRICFQTGWIHEVDRIVAGVGVKVQASL
jgi:hypothetical protein